MLMHRKTCLIPILDSFNQPFMTDAICSLNCLYTLVALLQTITVWNQIRLLLRSNLIGLNSVCFQSKNILECICNSCKNSGPKYIGRIRVNYKLELCYFYLQEEYLTSCYWRTSQQPVDTADKYDPSRPYYETYKVDFDQFKTMFLSIAPWAKGPRGGVLALRVFRVMFF